MTKADTKTDDTPTETTVEVTVDTTVEGFDPGWEHQRLDFAGDNLAVRAPTSQALAGFSLASSKYVPNDVKNDMTGLFIVEHLGPDSYGRVMRRLMDGDDPDYTTESVGLLMRDIVMLTTAAVTTDEDSTPTS
jgi:hypothetical protein